MSIQELIEQFEVELDEAVHQLPKVRADEIGLDSRCGMVWVDVEGEAIIVHKSRERTLNYYGGFEYIDSEYVINVGEYVIYREHDRVMECIERFTQEINS